MPFILNVELKNSRRDCLGTQENFEYRRPEHAFTYGIILEMITRTCDAEGGVNLATEFT